MNSGYFLLLLTAVFFCVASYAILLSALLPLTGVFVSAFPRFKPTPDSAVDSRCARRGHALQVLHHPNNPNDSIFRDCELGRMAVLSQFVISASARKPKTYHATWSIQNNITNKYDGRKAFRAFYGGSFVRECSDGLLGLR